MKLYLFQSALFIFQIKFYQIEEDGKKLINEKLFKALLEKFSIFFENKTFSLSFSENIFSALYFAIFLKSFISLSAVFILVSTVFKLCCLTVIQSLNIE